MVAAQTPENQQSMYKNIMNGNIFNTANIRNTSPLKGVRIVSLASPIFARVAMIEKHYGHVKLRDSVDQLAQNRSK